MALNMTPPRPKTPLAIVAVFLAFFSVKTKAQTPRDYLNTPVNAAAFFFDYASCWWAVPTTSSDRSGRTAIYDDLE